MNLKRYRSIVILPELDEVPSDPKDVPDDVESAIILELTEGSFWLKSISFDGKDGGFEWELTKNPDDVLELTVGEAWALAKRIQKGFGYHIPISVE